MFLAIMALIFYLTFGLIGSYLSDLLAGGIDALGEFVVHFLEVNDVNAVVVSLVQNGIFAGVGSVLSFIPMIIVMFTFMSLLEDTGYMARVAYMMDRVLRKIGLSGKSFVPLLLGFGCSVPAIMSTRTLSSDRDRKMTIFLTPFMSCTAKLPIYGVFAAALFAKNRALVIISLYLLGILISILIGLIIKVFFYKGKPSPFILELPSYRFPHWKSVLQLIWERAKDFLTRAFTVIFVASLVIWFLQTFDYKLNPVADPNHSMLSAIGHVIAPVFAPLGFGNWFSATSLITGFMAKEAVISTMAVLTGVSAAHVSGQLQTMFSPQTAYAFMVFCLLYTPCVAAISVVKRELGSGLAALGVVIGQTAVAWIVTFVVYHLLLLF
jgi:ferrous iron transport protein B